VGAGYVEIVLGGFEGWVQLEGGDGEGERGRRGAFGVGRGVG
jgi:hypothetical protein